MKPMYVNSISGLDMSTTRQEAKTGCAVLEAKISSFFTDEFRCFISMQSMADAQIVIYPSKSKVSVTRIGFGHSNEMEDGSDMYIKWKYLVLTRLMEKIHEDYGNTPFKEANNFITDVKAKAQSTMKILSDKSYPLLVSVQEVGSQERLKDIVKFLRPKNSTGAETDEVKKTRRNKTVSVTLPVDMSQFKSIYNMEKMCEKVFLQKGYRALRFINPLLAIAVTDQGDINAFHIQKHNTIENSLFFKENKKYKVYINY